MPRLRPHHSTEGTVTMSDIDMDKLRSDLSKSVTERFLREIPANAYKAPDPVTMESLLGVMDYIKESTRLELEARRDKIHAACVEAVEMDCGVFVDETACTAAPSHLVPAGQMYVSNLGFLSQFMPKASWVTG